MICLSLEIVGRARLMASQIGDRKKRALASSRVLIKVTKVYEPDHTAHTVIHT